MEIAKRLREWRKENLLLMKNLLKGMGVTGPDEEILKEYEWLAQDSIRLKNIIKKLNGKNSRY